jgi:hypothetical protein
MITTAVCFVCSRETSHEALITDDKFSDISVLLEKKANAFNVVKVVLGILRDGNVSSQPTKTSELAL